ncbi:hypothetical protein PIIN_05489 [Serendipita indica DSM 11827]|uniref:Kinesin light chain n=1 Tax=Serendipita indica (strain DSM 11827) TaxID=1109443 RepID=G4TJQ9_SERID|nr:hypothetical protein PIIN_05489 [Serendipita indica DSM 11827]
MSNLASIFHKLDRLEEAEKMKREVLALQLEILGPRHPDTILAMENLTVSLQFSDTLEPRHPDTILAMTNLAATLHRRSQLAEAEKIQRDVLALYFRVHGHHHQESLNASYRPP